MTECDNVCGIAGLVGYRGELLIHKMTDALAHRGPDGEGHFVDQENRVYLGHRRLAVIDVAGGIQPMWNRERTVGVVFNGEIYNHRELRRQLIQLGHHFVTDHSDTEVLVHGYREWKEDLPNKLNGMFSFAVLDTARSKILLARDRFGEKPLFFTSHDGRFAFASELTALLVPGVMPHITYDRLALKKFFAYCFFPAATTPYENIHKLPAGHLLIVDVESGNYSQREYWRFRIDRSSGHMSLRKEKELALELHGLIDRAVQDRLEADVPLGVFLSGGIDSSAVLSFAARHVDSNSLQAFTVGFDEPSFDETSWARIVARHIGCKHHVEVCRLEHARNRLLSLHRDACEPLGDPSIVPTSLLCEFTRKHVTVALSGDGGDELFFGYDPFKAIGIGNFYSSIMPKTFHQFIRRVIERLPISSQNMAFDFRAKRTMRGLSYSSMLWAPIWMGALDPEEISELFQEKADVEEIYHDALQLWESCESDNDLDRLAEFFTCFYLSDAVLTKVDRMSMRVGLEVRSPFLDINIVNFVRKLPAKIKFRHGQGKYILKKSLDGLLPMSILNRRKQGFGIPLAKWIGEFEIPSTMLKHIKLSEAFQSQMTSQHRLGRRDFRHSLFCFLALENGLQHPHKGVVL